MSENTFPQSDTSYSTLDVLVTDPSNSFPIPDGSTPGGDPSPVESQHSNWNLQSYPNSNSNSDMFTQNTLLDGMWPQQNSQSSADLFWNNANNMNQRSQGDFDMSNQDSNIQQAMAGINAAAPTQFPIPQSFQLPLSSSIGFDLGNVQQSQNYGYPQNSLFGNTNQSDATGQLSHALSRNSSYSSFTSLSNDGFTSNSNEALYDITSMGSQLLPPFQSTTNSNYSSRPVLPPIQVNAFSTPGKMGRPRSSSRITPYNRNHRSSSISTVASIDSVAPFSATTHMSFQSSSLASPHRSLAQGFGKMNLHHRRTSSKNSNYSAVKKQPSRSILSRSSRSASISVLRASDSVPFDFSATNSFMGPSKGANASEDQIQAYLQDKARNVNRTTSTAQQDKARTAWARTWLQKSFTPSNGFTVPRQGLFHSYCLASEDYGLGHINAASFGKAVRAAFPGIKTRRLGHRGNSKYHYVALRPALQIEAQRLNEYGDSNGRWFSTPHGTFNFKANESIGSMEMMGEERDDEDFDEHDDEEEDVLYPIKRSASTMSLSQNAHHRQSGSDDYTSRSGLIPPRMGMMRRHTTSAALSPPTPPPFMRVSELPNFPLWEEVACLAHPENDLRTFWQGFEQHHQGLLEFIDHLDFDGFEQSCRVYWFNNPYTGMCNDEDLSGIVDRAMSATYDHMIGMLLASADSTSLSDLKCLSNLAGTLEETMEVGFSNFSPEFKNDKVVLARNAAHLMQRVSEVGQVIAALSILTDGRASNLASAWHRLDLDHIVEQYMKSVSCDSGWVTKALNEFGSWLGYLENMPGRQHTKAIRKMISWLDSIIAPFAQEGILDSLPPKCTFITSHIMRAFTLSSEPQFGAFQLIKTLIDDYITIAAARHDVFAPNSMDDNEAGLTLDEYNGGLKVEIPRLGDGSFDSDPATAVPFRAQQPMVGMDSQFDLALLHGLESTDEDRPTFSYNDQQMIPQTDAMNQFLPKIE